jgi:sigma-B regulation protein RsbU (phosphoserine phosphatase)
MMQNNSYVASDRLTLLLNLTQAFNSSLDLDEVLDRVMDEVITAVHAERGFVMLRESNGRLTFRTARGMDQSTIDAPRFQVSRSVVESVAKDGMPVLTNDAMKDSRFSGRESVMMLGLRSILCAPLKAKENIIGVIYVDNRLQAGIFTHDDLDLLSAIASSAAIAIENARLYRVAVEKGRMDRELDMARRVQSSLLPSEAPHLTGWEFTARWEPAREVAGDYYDFPPCINGATGLVIADVTDKGMPAALFMALTRSAIRANVCETASPADGIARANRLVCAESTRGLFVTLFFGLLDPASGIITYVNAGHNPPLFYHAAGDDLTLLKATGMPLGIDKEAIYGQDTIRMQPGDFLVLYTDGITEAFDEQEIEFGMERLHQAVYDARHASVEEIQASLLRMVNEHLQNASPTDDITVVVVKRLQSNPL